MVAAFDLLVCLLMIFTILAITQKPNDKKTVKIETMGMIAIQIHWPDGSYDDVDLYVRDPAGRIVYFLTKDVGLMHLENDDLGQGVTGYDPSGVKVTKRGERVIIRGAIPGEYVVNVHMYNKSNRSPELTPVTAQLWRLRGSDKMVLKRQTYLRGDGDEKTVFRFTLDKEGNISNINYLPAQLVDSGRGYDLGTVGER
ncbi:MAG: hypothetical protein QXU32_02255 [Nitrososphaerales archaeon]